MRARATSAVIEFPQARVRPAAPREPGALPAEVVFFTGVRIERLPAEPEVMRKARGGATGKGRQRR